MLIYFIPISVIGYVRQTVGQVSC